MAKYFQIGSNAMNQSVYSGSDSSGAFYSGTHKTLAVSGIGASDTIEIPMIELPAGSKLSGISLQTDAAFAASGWTMAFVLRKKTNSIFTNSVTAVSGTASGAPDITLAGGTLNGSAGVGALVGGTVNPAVTAAINMWSSVFPQGIEGNTTVNGIAAARQILQEAYYLGLLFTASSTVSFNANVNIFMTADSEFIGTL